MPAKSTTHTKITRTTPVLAMILGSIGVVILALAEIDEHLSTRRGWYKK